MRIKASPEDFVVEEIPLYEPSGAGEHLYVRFTKRNLTTPAAVGMIARAVGVRERDVGVAGMKDKIGVTTQTISLPWSAGLDARVATLSLDGVTIHDARRHGNKLKTGHLRGNRFTIVIRELGGAAARERLLARFAEIATTGVPNAFGEQRFGKDADNAARALDWLRGKTPPPRDERLRRLLFSALQSAVFNAVLERRVADGTWATALEGDLLKKRDSGGLFLCTDVQTDAARAATGEVSATGPLPGVKMASPAGAPLVLEQEVTAAILGDPAVLEGTRALGEGTRRALRLLVEQLRAEPEQEDGLRVTFVLPKGAYATTVISSAAGAGIESDD